MSETGTGNRRFGGQRAAWVVALALLAVLVVVYWFRVVFGPLLLALALAYILEPLVQRMTARGWRRGTVVGVIFGIMLVLGLLLLFWLILQGASLVTALSENGQFRQGFESLLAFVRGLVAKYVPGGWETVQENAKAVADPAFWEPMVEPFLMGAQGVGKAVQGALASLSVLILLPLYLCYLMLDLERIWAWIKKNLPAQNRDKTLRVLGQIHLGMAAFLRGRVVVSVLKGIMTAVGLLICGTPLAVVVGLAAGILSIVPFIGPFLGFAVAMALTLAGTQAALGPVIGVIIVFAVAEFIEGFILNISTDAGGVFGSRLRHSFDPDRIVKDLAAALETAAVGVDPGRELDSQLQERFGAPLRTLLWERASLAAVVAGLAVDATMVAESIGRSPS